jgi:hypothetical protein
VASYSWTVSGTGNIISGTGATGTVTWDANFSGTATISVVAINGCGTSSPVSTTFTVNPTTAKGSITASSTICYNSSKAITLSGYTGTIQKWQSSTDGVAWSDISNTSNTYNANNLTQTTQFRAVVKSGSCSELTSDISTVTVTPYVQWLGGASNAWNNDANWCPATPSSGQPVLIPAGTTFQPVITSTAQCGNLTIANGATLTVASNFTASGAAVINGTLKFNSGASATLSSLTVANNAGVLGTVEFNAGTVTVNNNATINGIWTENGAAVINFKADANFTNAKYLNSGSPANGIQSYSTINVDGMLTLPSNGKITLLNSNVLTLGKDASYTNASQTNFVEGKLAKVTASTEPFIFPVGLNTLYRRIGIIPQNSSETTFTITYLNQSADAIGNASTDKSAIEGLLSTIEYWDIDREASSTTGAKVIMFWGTESDIAPTGDFDALKVAHYNTTLNKWESFPVVLADTYSANDGYMTTVDYLTNFSPATAEKADPSTLPVALKSFTVSQMNKAASLVWETTFESNNAGFEVERSYNGFQTYEKIGFVEGLGTAAGAEYSYLDASPAGPLAYYRLKQVDHNGKYRYSEIRYLQISRPVTESILYPNPTTGIVIITLEGIESETLIQYSIVGADGQVRVEKRKSSGSEINDRLSTDISNLNIGAYTIIIDTAKTRHSIRLIKI